MKEIYRYAIINGGAPKVEGLLQATEQLPEGVAERFFDVALGLVGVAELKILNVPGFSPCYKMLRPKSINYVMDEVVAEYNTKSRMYFKTQADADEYAVSGKITKPHAYSLKDDYTFVGEYVSTRTTTFTLKDWVAHVEAYRNLTDEQRIAVQTMCLHDDCNF